ncbi:Pyridine nucleotide-disulfide oxidoreductase domain-containing protein [Forsythia ovata]|uniref:Pyridine nucleotide-disulfide oxidoreductase domain-containing protein n=1 Tax=Forsythia ovata TaxID=205694 RepID=A0ABD1WKQ3_9LAMI
MQQENKHTAVINYVVAHETRGTKREEIFVDVIEKISVTFSSSAAKEIGALQVAKSKLEKEVEELTRQLQLEKCTRSGVHLVRGIVKDVQPQKIILSDGTDIPSGLLVWSTGVGLLPFVNSLDIPKHLVEGINKSASKQYIHFFATLFHQIVQIRILDFSKSFERNLLQSLGARPPWEL